MTVSWLLINLWPSILLIGVDFRDEGKPEYSEKNPRSTGEINNENSIYVKYHTRLGFSGERHNALTACVTRASTNNFL